MLTPQPYLTIVRLEREAREWTPRHLKDIDENARETSPTPVKDERGRRRWRGLVLNLRASLF